MVNSAEFAKRIEKILDYYGISATAFSEEIDVNRSTISHLLSGRNKPSLDFILKVIHHYPEVELYWLLNGKGDFPSTRSTNESLSGITDNISDQEENSANSIHRSIQQSKNNSIERIVVFFKDGSFKSYQN